MDEYGNQIEEPPVTQMQDVPAATEPVDLASALAAVRAQNKAVAQGAMEEGAGNDDNSSSSSIVVEGGGNISEASPASTVSEPVSNVADAEFGGPATPAQQADIQPGETKVGYQDEIGVLRDRANRQAYANVSAEFAKNKVRKYTLADITSKDEQRGTLVFNDIDNNRPFANRSEAQAWVDAMNKGIDDQFKLLLGQERSRLLNEMAPTARMLQYMPRYEKLPDAEKEIFDSVVEPYAMTDARGNVIGFSCDLLAAEQQVKQITKRLVSWAKKGSPVGEPGEPTGFGGGATSPPVAVKPAATSPALDMKSSSSNSGAGVQSTEPKTLDEAMRLISQQKAGKK